MNLNLDFNNYLKVLMLFIIFYAYYKIKNLINNDISKK